MAKPDIHRLIDLQRLLVQFATIKRGIDRSAGAGYVAESDTEHSYNLAIMAWFLADHFPELDRDTLIRYSLIHDLVEIHAGDTHVFDHRGRQTKQLREAQALQQLRAEWPDFPEIIDQIADYEALESAEAKFVYALDKIMPMLLNITADGHTWKKEGIQLPQIHGVKHDKVTLHPGIAAYYQELYNLLASRPDLFAKL